MKIIFICTGNTCRSPMAQAIGNHKIKTLGLEKIIKFESAGLIGPAGCLITKEAKNALNKYNLKIGSRKSKVFNKLKENNYKFIITMTNSLKQNINTPNCFSIFDFCGFEILDPYGQNQEVYNNTYNQIEKAVEIIINKIIKKGE